MYIKIIITNRSPYIIKTLFASADMSISIFNLRLLMIVFTVNRFLPKNNIYKKKNNKKQRIHKSYIIGNLLKIHYFLVSPLSILARTKDRIPRLPFNVNTKTSPILSMVISCGSKKTTPNQPAAKLIKNSDSISSQPLSNLNIILAYLA